MTLPMPPERPAVIIMPCLNCWDYTKLAVIDAINQTLDTTLLVVDNGSTDQTRPELDELSLEHPGRLLSWHHDPPLPSLSACWNRALRFAWENGAMDALVVNNDVRLHPRTFEVLRRRMWHDPTFPLFVTGIGVNEEDFNGDAGKLFNDSAGDGRDVDMAEGWFPTDSGGPDFSCFLIRREGHEKYPFDEGFIPAYHEDNDMHRRYKLGGDTDRIFGCAVPFLHWGSRTVNQSEAFTQKFHGKFQQSADYYKRKWGGDVGEETFDIPFNKPETAPTNVIPADRLFADR